MLLSMTVKFIFYTAFSCICDNYLLCTKSWVFPGLSNLYPLGNGVHFFWGSFSVISKSFSHLVNTVIFLSSYPVLVVDREIYLVAPDSYSLIQVHLDWLSHPWESLLSPFSPLTYLEPLGTSISLHPHHVLARFTLADPWDWHPTLTVCFTSASFVLTLLCPSSNSTLFVAFCNYSETRFLLHLPTTPLHLLGPSGLLLHLHKLLCKLLHFHFHLRVLFELLWPPFIHPLSLQFDQPPQQVIEAVELPVVRSHCIPDLPQNVHSPLHHLCTSLVLCTSDPTWPCLQLLHCTGLLLPLG